MIQEMIECGAIDLKEGIFTKNFILDNDYIQSFKFKIDNKFKKLKFDKNKKNLTSKINKVKINSLKYIYLYIK